MTQKEAGVSGGEISVVLGGIASMLAVVIPALTGALRKRRDVTISELEKRIGDMVKRQDEQDIEIKQARAEIASLQDQIVKYEFDNFNLRRTLAANGIPVPPEVTP